MSTLTDYSIYYLCDFGSGTGSRSETQTGRGQGDSDTHTDCALSQFGSVSHGTVTDSLRIRISDDNDIELTD